MVVTISKNGNGTLNIRSKSREFELRFKSAFEGGGIVCYPAALFAYMWEISDYANNALKEECVFDVE